MILALSWPKRASKPEKKFSIYDENLKRPWQKADFPQRSRGRTVAFGRFSCSERAFLALFWRGSSAPAGWRTPLPYDDGAGVRGRPRVFAGDRAMGPACKREGLSRTMNAGRKTGTCHVPRTRLLPSSDSRVSGRRARRKLYSHSAQRSPFFWTGIIRRSFRIFASTHWV